MKRQKSEEAKRRIREARHEAREAKRAKKKARKAAERRRPSYPRMSPNAIWYTLKIYGKAVGRKRYFFWFYQGYSSIMPSVTALLAGAAVTRITEAITTHDFLPFLWIAIIMLVIQLANTILGQVYNLLQVSTWQDVYIYVSEKIANKYIQIPLAVRESQSFADKFNRVQDYGSMIASVSSSLISIITSVISLISVLVATLAISPLVTIAVALAAIPYSILSLKLSARQRRNWREYTYDRRIAWAIENKIIDSNSALEIEMNGMSKYLVHRMIKARRHGQEQDIIDRRRFLLPSFGADMLESLASFGVLIFVAIEIMLEKLEIG
jgi:ABC-type bacteriocin/lantibiotic exporter with double-glycine peptidase domain